MTIKKINTTKKLGIKTPTGENLIELGNTDKVLVTQSNTLINAGWRLNLTQTRIYLTLLSMIQPDDDELKRYKLNATTLKNLFSLKGESIYQALKDDIVGMLTKVITITTKNDNDEEKELWTTMISSATYEEGTLTFKFDSDLKPYLLNLKEQFTQAKLIDLIEFKSQYTIRIFLCLKQFESTGIRILLIKDIRKMLDLDKTRYNQLKKDKFLNLTSPSKLQLYLASGKPIIGEISGECKKIINLSKSGFCVNHEDSKDLLKKINFFFKIRNNKNKINYYCNNSRDFYENNFSINKITSRFIKIIE